jgi:hypothetical protein
MDGTCSTHEINTKSSSENMKGRDHSVDLDADGRILEWILEKHGGKLWAGCIWLRKGTSGGSCEHGNEPSASIKGGN